MHCGLICHTTQHQTNTVHQLETRSECGWDGRTPNSLGQILRVRISTVLLDWQMPQKGQGREGVTAVDSPGVEITALVSGTVGPTSGLPPVTPEQSNTADRPIQQSSSAADSRPATTSCLEVIRQRQQAAGISRETSQLLAAGWSKGTNATYQSAWKRWDSWCSERQIDPVSCPIQPFLEFLTSLFQEGMQYHSVNTIRSAVSMTHEHIEGIPVGKHPMISQLLKGMYNLRPPQPRYSTTWDVDIVIRYLQSLGSNDGLSLKVLSQKLLFLMALVQASRVSELQALDLRYRTFRSEGVVFVMSILGKKRTAGAPPKQVMFGAFPDDSRLCVVQCLKRYEGVTQQYRTKEPSRLNLCSCHMSTCTIQLHHRGCLIG